MDKKNIAFFTTSTQSIGPFNQVSELAIELSKKKYNVIVIVSSPIKKNRIVKKLLNNEIPIFSLNAKSFFNFFQLFRLIKVLKNNKCEIIHSRLRRADFYANISKIFIKITVINHIVDDYLNHFKNYHKYLSTILAIIYTMAQKNADAIIVNNKKNLQFYLNRDFKSFYLRNGVRTVMNDKAKYTLNKNVKSKFIIGYVGEFKKGKGIGLLINIIKQFKNNNDYNFIICGKGDYKKNNFLKEFKNYANVDYCGYVEDLEEKYLKFDTQIFTSKSEGMPNVLLESLSYGIIPICTNINAYNEIVSSDMGYTIKSDPVEFYNKIKDLKNNKNLTKNFNKACLMAIDKKFKFETITKELIQIYKVFN